MSQTFLVFAILSELVSVWYRIGTVVGGARTWVARRAGLRLVWTAHPLVLVASLRFDLAGASPPRRCHAPAFGPGLSRPRTLGPALSRLPRRVPDTFLPPKAWCRNGSGLRRLVGLGRNPLGLRAGRVALHVVSSLCPVWCSRSPCVHAGRTFGRALELGGVHAFAAHREGVPRWGGDRAGLRDRRARRDIPSGALSRIGVGDRCRCPADMEQEFSADPLVAQRALRIGSVDCGTCVAPWALQGW